MRYEVILDIGETANKCTIAPLSYREDFRLFHVSDGGPLGPLSAPVLLHHEGSCLTEIRRQMGTPPAIATVDCVWRRLEGLVRRIEGELPVLARIPAGIVTAYPRKSAHDFDPVGGLATIEAIFVAAAILGHWDATLLSEYHFGRGFVELNRDRLIELGVGEAANPELWPSPRPRARNALQRRRDRGRPN